MDKTAFLNKITEIGTCEDDSTRRTLLTELGDSATELFDNVETLTQANTDFEEKVKKLQEDNMSLFLQIGENRNPQGGSEPPAEKRKYENLFNSEGKLK